MVPQKTPSPLGIGGHSYYAIEVTVDHIQAKKIWSSP